MALIPFPDAKKYVFKDKFIERYSKLTDWDEFSRYSLSFLRKSIRVNTLKISVNDLKKRLENEWKLEQIPWCKEGFWIEGIRRDIGNLPEHLLGYIYIQESASMIPPVALDPKEGEKVLDVCAAPGSKTTQMSAMMKNTGIIVANDIVPSRLKVLELNCQRCGAVNVIRTNMKYITGFEFDKVLLDAPCSGIGTIRKSPKTINMWNPKFAFKLSIQQKGLLKMAHSMLKEGGEMVYSTCTLEPEENEAVIDYAIKELGMKVQKINIDIKRSKPVLSFEEKEYDKSIKDALRIWPKDNDTEGFFVCKL